MSPEISIGGTSLNLSAEELELVGNSLRNEAYRKRVALGDDSPLSPAQEEELKKSNILMTLGILFVSAAKTK